MSKDLWSTWASLEQAVSKSGLSCSLAVSRARSWATRSPKLKPPLLFTARSILATLSLATADKRETWQAQPFPSLISKRNGCYNTATCVNLSYTSFSVKLIWFQGSTANQIAPIFQDFVNKHNILGKICLWCWLLLKWFADQHNFEGHQVRLFEGCIRAWWLELTDILGAYFEAQVLWFTCWKS